MTPRLRKVQAKTAHASWVTRLRGPIRVGLAVIGAGLFLALAGAFGSGEESLVFRLVYWIGVIAVGTLMAYVVSSLVCKVVDAKARPWVAAVLVTVILAVMITGFLAVLSRALFSEPVTLKSMPRLYFEVLVVTAAMTALVTAVDQWPKSGKPEPVSGPAKFLDRLPHSLRGAAILAVEAEDHYLRVHTGSGDTLILMRLSDAIHELVGVEGARVHRSWWVARSAIESVRRAAGRPVLVLKGKISVPVSRTYAPSLREAGWL